MFSKPQESQHLHSSATLSSPWHDELVRETERFHELGLHAAMVSVRLKSCADTDTTRLAAQARTLFGLILRPTDRVQQTTPVSFSILLSPQRDLAETNAQASTISNAFAAAQISASTGFAQRRPTESLVDTWARSEAELDRAAYRSDNSNGLSLI